jgi:2-keto-4-pentenoate hydratase/2-oxohepta-3-ene-1,7-dioic acid hydratase in catechol pathway
MRMVTVNGRAGLLIDDEVWDLETISNGTIPSDPITVLAQHWDDVRRLHQEGATGAGQATKDLTLGPPIPRPPTIFGIGLNYRKHAEETGATVTWPPAVFAKYPTAVTGPYDDVVLPAAEHTADWEAELAFVVARGGRYISAERAYDHLAGFCVAQDISERRLQRAAGGQFNLGKSFDTFCPLGPALVTLDELDDPADLPISCQVNGELMQSDTTADLIVDIPHLVELLSSVVTLRPGDVCITGTPSGVGHARQPPVYLKPGDVIETEIRGIGQMRNRCIAEAP